jgi:hypothetical protein
MFWNIKLSFDAFILAFSGLATVLHPKMITIWAYFAKAHYFTFSPKK